MRKNILSLTACIGFLAFGLALGYVIPRAPAWFKPSYVEGDYSAYLKDANARVVVYGTSWCPYCAKTRAYFASHHISYRDIDVEKTPGAMQQFRKLGGGAIPKVLIGNRMIVGFVPDAFEKALQNVGHPQ